MLMTAVTAKTIMAVVYCASPTAAPPSVDVTTEGRRAAVVRRRYTGMLMSVRPIA